MDLGVSGQDGMQACSTNGKPRQEISPLASAPALAGRLNPALQRASLVPSVWALLRLLWVGASALSR